MCKECQIAKQDPAYWIFNPACIHCGARILRKLESMPIGQSECRQRQKNMLKHWQAMGHDELELRRLYKHGPCIGPVAEPVSVAQSETKPQSRKKR